MTKTILTVGALLWAGTALAADAESKCQAARATAASKYASCQQKAAKRFSEKAFSKCRVTYTGTWAKLQKKALVGSSCIGARFADNGATVTDNLTGLQWEKKANLDFFPVPSAFDPHDADNIYTLCLDDNFDFSCDNAFATDGTAFTDFLLRLNSNDCFGGQCDWRLPTRDELQTILADPYTGDICKTSSCIDPIFGPTQSLTYWSAASYAGYPSNAWGVFFL
jgi:hypothetical protein